jgi:hypothetical protein
MATISVWQRQSFDCQLRILIVKTPLVNDSRLRAAAARVFALGAAAAVTPVADLRAWAYVAVRFVADLIEPLVPEQDASGRSDRLVAVLVLATELGCLLAPGRLSVPQAAAGGTLLLAALILRHAALARLGAASEVLGGAYRWMAHPAAWGLCGSLAGVVVMMGSAVGALCLAVLLPFLLVSLAQEERSLPGRAQGGPAAGAGGGRRS